MGRKRFLGRSKGHGLARASHWLQASATRRRRLVVERLEDRCLLATMFDSGELFSQLAVDPGSYRSSSLLVQFREGTSAASFACSPVTYAGTSLGEEWAIAPGLRRVQLDFETDVEQALVAYRSNPNVLFAEPDYRVSLQLLPDDPTFSALWGLDNQGQGSGALADADIDAPEAWDITTGSRSVVVAVIDTGVDHKHPDLAANMWVNADEIPGNGIDDDKNGYRDDIHGFDFANDDGDPMDDHFHGTHVAGTIGAVGNNGVGIAGVNWNVQIMALKFLDAGGGGFTSDAIEALNYAVANGATVSNNSWGGGVFSSGFFTALQNARAAGHIFVAAAGNDGWNNDLDPFFPAGYNADNILSVAATDIADELAWFSNYGVKSVDLAAPGVSIYSTFPTVMTDAMREGGFERNYETISGTSMATPHVTGVVALVQALHDDWSYERVIEQVLGTVDVIDGAAETVTGGRLNAAAAVGNAPPDTAGPRVIATEPTGNVGGTVAFVRLRFSESIDVATIGLGDVVSISGPDGSIAALSLAPVAGSSRQFDVTFAPQTALGNYTLVLGANISDLSGNLLDQDRDGIGGEAPDDLVTATFTISDIVGFPSDDVPAPIHNTMTTGSFLTIDQDLSISDLNVQLDISYPYDGDLAIYLESPRGTSVILSAFNGGIDPDFAGTIFDDEAPVPISSGFAPYEGAYQPDEVLSAFDGQNARGQWTLWIEAWPFYGFLDGDGWLDAWTLQIDGGGSSPPPPPPPPPGNRPPVAGDDALDGDVNAKLLISPEELLANDTDPDGDKLSITFVGNPSGGIVSLGQDKQITFEPDHDFRGQAKFQYIVSDGSFMATGNVTIDVQPVFQWNNRDNPLDVDDDGHVAPLDALLLFNLLNVVGSTPIEFIIEGSDPTMYYDVAPDNYITPLDPLLVINYLNGPEFARWVASSTSPAVDEGGEGNRLATAAVDQVLSDPMSELLEALRPSGGDGPGRCA